MSKPRPRAERRAADPDVPVAASDEPGVLPWWQRPWRWVADTMRRPVKLESRDGQVHVVLAQPRPRPVKVDPAEAADRELQRARAELAELLDRHRATRKVMPHLGVVEKGLRKLGWRALRKLPAPVLHAALGQLQNLIHNEASAGLADLRARMANEIEVKALAKRVGGDSDLSVPAAQRPEVSEATHSLFDEMERSWTGELSAERLAALDAAKAASKGS